MAVMLPFAQLWGPTGTIMTMLGQVLPGIQLYLLLIAGLLTFFYLRRIKDPESDLKDIFSFVLVIGGISLLVFGNLMVLILVIGMFSAGYLMLHHWMKQSEHTPAAAVQTLQQLHPDVAKKIADLETGMQTLTAKEAKTASEEKRVGHDFAVIEADVATIAAINEKAAKAIERLNLQQMSAEEREAAILKVWQEHAAQMEKELGQTYSVSGTEQQARFRLNESIGFIEQQAKDLTTTEQQILQSSLKDAQELIQQNKLAFNTAKRAKNLSSVISGCVEHFKKNTIGNETVALIQKELVDVLKTANATTDPGMKAAQMETAESFKNYRAAAEAAAASLQESIKETKSQLTKLSPLIKKMADFDLAAMRKKMTAAATALQQVQTELQTKQQEFTAKIAESRKSAAPPETFGGPLIALVDNLFKTIIKSREKRLEFNNTLLTLLNAFGDNLTTEKTVIDTIDAARNEFADTETALATINQVADKVHGATETTSLDAAKAAVQQLEIDANKAQNAEISTALQTVSAASSSVKKQIANAQTSLKNARAAHQTGVDSLKRAFMGIMNTQAKIINFKAESIKKQNDALNTANKARAA